MGEKYIRKPLSVAYSDFVVALSNVINESMLPPFVIELVLKGMINDVHILTQNRLRAESEEYKRMQDEFSDESYDENGAPQRIAE